MRTMLLAFNVNGPTALRIVCLSDTATSTTAAP